MADANFQKRRSVCFICSPSLGILDNWLPVSIALKENEPGVELVFVLPKANSVDLIDPDNVLIKMGARVFDKIIFRTHSGLWLEVEKFEQAKKINNLTSVEQFFYKVARRGSRFNILKAFSNLIHYVLGCADRKKNAEKIIDLRDSCRPFRAVLFDVYEEQKEYTADLMRCLHGVPKYSIKHGVNIEQGPIVCRCPDGRKEKEVKAYLFSSEEIEYYKRTYCLRDEELKVVGIPRHDKKWIERIIAEGRELPGAISWKGYIFIISRSLSPYFTYERKKKAIEDIRRLAFGELKMKLVIKFHPKERSDGLYEKILGRETYGSQWVFSNAHPFILGQNSSFAISFFSSVAIDMVALGVPVIERLDLRGIEEFDNNESLRDDHGEPVFSFRYLGLALGASDYDRLKYHALNILRERNRALQKLQDVYNKNFPVSPGVPTALASEILSNV